MRLCSLIEKALLWVFEFELKRLIFNVCLVTFANIFSSNWLQLIRVNLHWLVGIEISCRLSRLYFHLSSCARNSAHFIETIAGLALLHMTVIWSINVYSKTDARIQTLLIIILVVNSFQFERLLMWLSLGIIDGDLRFIFDNKGGTWPFISFSLRWLISCRNAFSLSVVFGWTGGGYRVVIRWFEHAERAQLALAQLIAFFNAPSFHQWLLNPGLFGFNHLSDSPLRLFFFKFLVLRPIWTHHWLDIKLVNWSLWTPALANVSDLDVDITVFVFHPGQFFKFVHLLPELLLFENMVSTSIVQLFT